MDVFISWSGIRSKQVAEILTDWLPQVIQSVNPWMSKDIDKGARWSPEISEKLAQSNIGIICLTPENFHADWILFEAGALSKIKENKVCTFLMELNPTDIEQPLAQFQHTTLSYDDVKTLLITINKQLSTINDHPLSEKTLNSVFEKNWPDLESRIKAIQPITKSRGKKQERSDRDLIEEILELTRRQVSESMRREEMENLRREELTYRRRHSVEISTNQQNQKMLSKEFPIFKDLYQQFDMLLNNEGMTKKQAREKIYSYIYSDHQEPIFKEIPKGALELFFKTLDR